MNAPKMRISPKKEIPRFETEDQEREFWARHEVVDFFDWDRAVKGRFPALKPSTTTISLRLPASMLDELKTLANARDVPYQSLLKMYLAERMVDERASGRWTRSAKTRKPVRSEAR